MQEAIQLLLDLEFHLPVNDAVKEENNEIISNQNFSNSSDEDHYEDRDEDHDSLSHRNSCSSDRVNENRKRKRRRRLEHYKSMQMIFKRVLKNDVRKLFPAMYCNAANRDDLKLFERFVSRFMTPKCKFISHPLPQLDRPYCSYEGPEQHVLHVQSLVAFLPDHALIPLGSRIIRQLLDEDISIVELYANAKATKLVYYDDQLLSDESIVSSDEECSFIPIQPSKVMVDIDIVISFYFNKDGFVVKTMASIATSIPSFNSV